MNPINNYKRINFYPFLLTSLILLLSSGTSCQTKPDNQANYSLRLIPTEIKPISKLLMGFNTVYSYEADSVWSDGKIEGYLKDVNTNVMRYPGGTVSSYYHWNELTGEGWNDSWEPNNKIIPKSKSEFMDLDEFMALAKRNNITPLLGINMSSGRRWNRIEDGIQEAIALMSYCRDKKFDVEYWYLDNEPYMDGSNGGSKTIEEYASLVNQFVPRMKAFQPNIKIIVNWKSAFRNERENYRKLLKIAGQNIDIIDAHWYWSWSKPTFEKWMNKTPMAPFTGENYITEIAYFHQMTKDYGYPDIKLAALEWNVGPIREKQLSPHQNALIQSEMMMQFILGGLDMATFWPLQGGGGSSATRTFVNSNDRSAHPAFNIFKFLGKIQGGSLIKSEKIIDTPNTLSLVAFDETKNFVRVCLLNKNEIDILANFKSDIFKNMKLIEANSFVLGNQGEASHIQAIKLEKNLDVGISFEAPLMSISMLTFEKK